MKRFWDKVEKTELANGERHKDIAKSYNVGRVTITYVNTKRNWSHVA